MVTVLVIGGGLVGLAAAWQLAQRARVRVTVLEKEDLPARHQSGRNSGVLHSGVYYRPGSLKARLCRAGKSAMEQFCREQDLPLRTCGKVIVATSESELPRLAALHERAAQNGVRCERIERARLLELEPAAAGIAALHVPETGVTSFPAVASRLVELLRGRGHDVRFGVRVLALRSRPEEVVAETSTGPVAADFAVACAGLHSDRLLLRSGGAADARIVPFRGEYYELRAERSGLCRGLIYPVPDPAFPFLGVHFTRGVDGRVECGPNAVLALAREGYRWRDVSLRDVAETFAWPGARRLFARHWRAGLGELRRSLSRRAFWRALRRLVPAVELDDLRPVAAGVRAQAVARDGSLVEDFELHRDGRVLHVLNAPSPAATASFAIGAHIVAELSL
jgi:L-2-hydroxyglutarate oxidase